MKKFQDKDFPLHVLRLSFNTSAAAVSIGEFLLCGILGNLLHSLLLCFIYGLKLISFKVSRNLATIKPVANLQ